MKKLLFLFLTLTVFISACKKDTTTTNNNSKGAQNDTITQIQHCLQQSIDNYNASGQLTSASKFYYSSKRLDSITTHSSNPNADSKIIYTYSSSNERWGANYYNGVLSGTKYKEVLDNNGNVIRQEVYSSNSLSSYSVSSWSCQ